MEQRLPRSHPIQSVARLILDQINDSSRRFHIVSLNREIAACEKLLGQDDIINVAILGQFKAGKSSFINSLIGYDVLPVGAIPVTTVITRLYYGKEPKAIVRQVDGNTISITIDEVGQFVSEEMNPANEKNVEVVDIELPTLEQYHGLRLIDTPGLGSVFKYNTDTSEEWLPEVGAAIVAVSADRPLSANDVALLRQLMKYTPRIMLLLTKTDLLSQDEQDKVTHYLKNTLHREIHQILPIYPYSTRMDTDLLKGRIASFLLDLSANLDVEFDDILRHKLASLSGSTLAYLQIALKTSQKADEDRENLKHLILTEKLNHELIRSELFVIARDNMQRTRGVITERFEIKKADLTRLFVDRLCREMPGWKGNLWHLTRKYEEWLEENLSVEIGELSRKEHRYFFVTLKSRSLDLFRSILSQNIETVLGVKLSPPE
jgi:GTP-binding protein EngB required for normal cell division